jgi:hypothetical protein
VEQPVPAHRKAFLAAFMLAALAPPAPAQDLDTETRPWKEIEAALPVYPRQENLVPLVAGQASGHQFFVDAPSLSIGSDGVVRYTLVIRASGGATNVTHEGIRCDQGQLKTYAVGQTSGAWRQARDPQWRRIEYRTINNHHAILYSDYFCERGQPLKSTKEMVQRLRRPILPIQVSE